MSIPRRRLIRSHAPTPSDLDRQRQHDKIRGRLERERQTLSRWMQRLRRAFHAVEKSQRRIARFERFLARAKE